MVKKVTPVVVKCKDCAKEYRTKKALNIHVRKFHDPKKKKPALKCISCGAGFYNEIKLQAHLKKFHNKENVRKFVLEHENQSNHNSAGGSPTVSSQKSCHCNVKCTNHESLLKHLVTQHGVKVEKEDYKFASHQSFEAWKTNIQQRESSFYSLESPPQKLPGGEAWNLFYNCHHSYSPQSSMTCPSRMIVTIMDNFKQPSWIKLRYWKTHFGHQLKQDADIAGNPQEDLSLTRDLDSISNNMDNIQDISQRLSILEMEDLHNIIRDFNINYCTEWHQNDAISVKTWVSKMQSGKDNPVLYYKGPNEHDNDTFLKDSDFAIIIMTAYQANQLIEFGRNKICVDRIDAYEIRLYTVMTVDEFGTGCPVAYCFSNRSGEQLLKLFFQKVHRKVGTITTQIFMSNDDQAVYNAWTTFMPEVKTRLLCSWHVDRDWRANLSKIRDAEQKTIVYRMIKDLQHAANMSKFETKLEHMLLLLKKDRDTAAFGEYFRTRYAGRPKLWAYCYRKGFGINTLESFHAMLKHIVLEGRKINRLDKTINAVLSVAQNGYLGKGVVGKGIVATNTDTAQKNRQIRGSHKSAQNLPNDLIRTLDESREWMVMSSSVTTVQYHVRVVGETCSDACWACASCKVCIHTFQCSCNDNIVELNLCKHIHACSKERIASGFSCDNMEILQSVKREIESSDECDPLTSGNAEQIQIGCCVVEVPPAVQEPEAISRPPTERPTHDFLVHKFKMIMRLLSTVEVPAENLRALEKELVAINLLLDKK